MLLRAIRHLPLAHHHHERPHPRAGHRRRGHHGPLLPLHGALSAGLAVASRLRHHVDGQLARLARLRRHHQCRVRELG